MEAQKDEPGEYEILNRAVFYVSSDMTLLDDSFKSIANAVMWGRSLYRNLQRFLFFQLVVNVAALLLVLGGSVIGVFAVNPNDFLSVINLAPIFDVIIITVFLKLTVLP